METPPKPIEVEVVNDFTHEEHAHSSPSSRGPPIHPLSALLLLVVDNLWNFADWAVIDWFITIPLSFISVFVPCFVIQKFLKKDSLGRALGYSLLLGVIAAVPTSVTGTPVGLAILAWTGLSKLMEKPPTR